MSDILFYSKAENIPGIIMNLDYASAFDSVEHVFLFEALRAYNFGESLISWIKLLYNCSELTVLNNGYTGEWFKPTRGVKQGCPVSGMIFVLAVELFACKLRSRTDIKGIKIKEVEIKISQYADDTAIFVDGKESAGKVMEMLQSFGEISCLRLNPEKCDFVWIGRNRLKMDTICGIEPKTKFKSLGIFFSTGDDDCINDNIEPMVRKVRNVINMWRERDLSIKGRITLTKSLIASQLTYSAIVVNIPSDILKTLDKEINSFMWRGRPPKVKRSVICQPIERGGLGAINIVNYIQSIQLSWLRRMLTSTDAKWQILLQQAIGHISIEDLLRANLSEELVERLCLPSFYCKIISTYYGLKPTPKANYIDIQKQCLWYNVDVQIDNDVVFFSKYVPTRNQIYRTH